MTTQRRCPHKRGMSGHCRASWRRGTSRHHSARRYRAPRCRGTSRRHSARQRLQRLQVHAGSPMQARPGQRWPWLGSSTSSAHIRIWVPRFFGVCFEERWGMAPAGGTRARACGNPTALTRTVAGVHRSRRTQRVAPPRWHTGPRTLHGMRHTCTNMHMGLRAHSHMASALARHGVEIPRPLSPPLPMSRFRPGPLVRARRTRRHLRYWTRGCLPERRQWRPLPQPLTPHPQTRPQHARRGCSCS